jgi:HK97 family phage prohead protease
MRPAWKVGDRIQCDLAFQAITVADVPDGSIKGIASTSSTDLYGHKVFAGAFDKSIQRKGLSGPKGVKLLAGHDWNKPAGVIKKLETVNDKLEIEAQLNLNVSYVKDLYEVAKQNEGLNFSVGFMLEEFEFIDKKADAIDDEWLQIKQGDLMEVSVVCFPACLDATMDFVKHADTAAEFEKALITNGWAFGRKEAHRLFQLCRNSVHLLTDKGPPSAALAVSSNHPVPDAHQLSASLDLMRKAQAILGRR